jgi:hypothetical protein
MKNRFEGYCYVCGDVVPEEQGIAEPLPRNPGEAGWGQTKWCVRHTACKPPAPGSIERKDVARDSAEQDAGAESETES